MFRKILTVATAAFLASALAGPVSARPVQHPPKQKSVEERKYCIQDATTGSRLIKTQCKTKAQWAHEGVEIPEPGRGKGA